MGMHTCVYGTVARMFARLLLRTFYAGNAHLIVHCLLSGQRHAVMGHSDARILLNTRYEDEIGGRLVKLTNETKSMITQILIPILVLFRLVFEQWKLNFGHAANAEASAMSSSQRFQSPENEEKRKKWNRFFPLSLFTLLAGLWMGPLCGIPRLKLPNANKRNKATHSLVDCQHYYKVIISSRYFFLYKRKPHKPKSFFFSLGPRWLMANYYLASILFAKKDYCIATLND